MDQNDKKTLEEILKRLATLDKQNQILLGSIRTLNHIERTVTYIERMTRTIDSAVGYIRSRLSR